MKKRLVSLFVENVPREKVPADCTKFTCFERHGRKYICGSQSGVNWWIAHLKHIAELAEVGESVTREELMRAYDLVEQGYTLWFGGDCPVSPVDVVSVVLKDYVTPEKFLAAKVKWENNGISEDVIAYKIVEPAKIVEVSMGYVAVREETLPTTITGQYVERDGDKIFFTPEEVVSVAKQIHGGDLLTTKHGTTVEVLYIGKTNVFLRDSSSGEEFSASHLDVLEFYDY